MNLREVERLKEVCRNAAAKSGYSDDDLEKKQYLPLWMHLTDTAGVMEKLFDHRLSRQEKRLFIEAAGSEEMAKKLFCLVGFLHDFGKMTARFQAMIFKNHPEESSFQLGTEDLAAFPASPYHHHTVMGMAILDVLGVPEWIGSLAGAHHGKTANSFNDTSENIIDKFSDFCGVKKIARKDDWIQSWQQMLEAILSICQLQMDEIDEMSFDPLPVNLLMLLDGYLIEADWIASNPEYFPLIDLEDTGDPALYPERIEQGWKHLGFNEAWKAGQIEESAQQFRETFSFDPNPLQTELMKILDRVQKPGIVIIEAPMGMGKTEAALMAAQMLAGKNGSGGIFFGLPTQATANGLFGRFLEWSEKQSQEHPLTIKLAHGSASFNPEYGKLPVGQANLDQDGNGEKQNVTVHEWMKDSKRGLISDFVIGTVDQALMTGLNSRHVMLRHAGIAGKVVIIDEVHAYDAYMGVYFKRMLEWLGSYRVPVLLLSATLPAAKRMEFLNAYQYGRYENDWNKDQLNLSDLQGYPSILWTDGRKLAYQSVKTETEPKKIRIKMLDYDGNAGEQDEFKRIAEVLKKKLSQGGCAGIILNTVAKAQRFAAYLKEEMPELNQIVFHSRFTRQRRAEIEEAVLSTVGKNSTPEQRDHTVIIGTQVLEQSLDVDFDLLITELAPMDLLLQRIGRLHRHKAPNGIRRLRPKPVSEPECFVVSPEGDALDPAVKHIYADWYLHRTKEELKSEICIPDDIPQLVNNVYNNPDNDELNLDEKKELHDLNSQIGDSIEKAEQNELKSPIPIDFGLGGLNDFMLASAFSTDNQAQSGVRDITGGMNVVLLRQETDGFITGADHSCDWHLNPKKKPNEEQIRNMMAETISLPLSLDNKNTEDLIAEQSSTILPAWARIPELKWTDIMVLNHENEIQIQDDIWKYDQQYGLMKK